MLSLTAVEAGYNRLQILRGLTLEVPSGSVIGILGGNGVGKSTTMRAIAGLIPVWRGQIMLDGEPLHRLRSDQIFAHGIALVAQGRELFPDMTVFENLELGAISASTRSRVAEIMGEVFEIFPCLRERTGQRAGSLSGGEQQMLATGRALMSKPKVLLLDEPTTGLAPLVVEELQRTIGQLNRAGQTIVLVEQNTRMALQVVHHVFVLNGGRVVLSRPASELVNDEELVKSYFG
jgi:branched-chain amino acid transport system ATP-binding protein